MDTQQKPNVLSIPVAIIVAGAFIALAVIYTNSAKSVNTDWDPNTEETVKVMPITADDRILGNPNAEIIVVEYSDTECPFCKVFHSTMHRVIDTYGKDGKVAWVYRHLPITNLHPRAWNEAIATECAGVLAGNAGFWKYTDRIYDITQSNNKLDPAKLTDIAREQGFDMQRFTACLDNRETEDKVQKDYDDGVQLSQGRPATPTSVILLKERLSTDRINTLKGIVSQAGLDSLISIPANDPTKIIIRGAFPYEVLSLMVTMLLE